MRNEHLCHEEVDRPIRRRPGLPDAAADSRRSGGQQLRCVSAARLASLLRQAHAHREDGIVYEHGDHIPVIADGMLMIVRNMWLWSKRGEQFHAIVACKALFAPILQALRGGIPPAASVRHASAWLAGAAEMVQNHEAPIRFLAFANPLCIPGQLAPGAAARHQARGTIWHISGTSIVTGVVLWFTVRVLLHYADFPALLGSAVTLLIITSVQVFLEWGLS